MSDPRFNELEILRLQMFVKQIELETFSHYVAQPERTDEIARILSRCIHELRLLIDHDTQYICPPNWWKEPSGCISCPVGHDDD